MGAAADLALSPGDAEVSAEPSLRVLVDGVSARLGGGATYLISQLNELARLPDLELAVHAVGDVADELAAACPRATVAREPARPLPLRLAWEQVALQREARHCDVVYAPGNFALMACPRPQVLLLQNALVFGQAGRSARRLFPRRERARMALESAAARASVRRATRVIAVSWALADAVEADLGRLAKLSVLTSPAPTMTPAPPAAQAQAPAPPYVVAVAHDLPHKDWDGIVSAFLEATDLPPLVLVGGVDAGRLRRLRSEVEVRAPGRVTFTGPIDDRSSLADLYAHASCCVAHSHVEATGLTGLEALSLGIPVAAADLGAHREALGDAAVYYPADRPGELAAAVRRAMSDPADPSGTAVASAGTWTDNAAGLAAVLHDAARAGRG